MATFATADNQRAAVAAARVMPLSLVAPVPKIADVEPEVEPGLLHGQAASPGGFIENAKNYVRTYYVRTYVRIAESTHFSKAYVRTTESKSTH